ncbi:MAG TPA: M10 family metallopeptidase C-terminal domain-containing protein [Rhizomicrobium sp.]|nr:M10 family metallopeptidase C-terminal domain-containing protein [Rhizomicrobium sp.]
MKSILKTSAAVAALLVVSATEAGAVCVITGTSGDDTLTASAGLPPCDTTLIGLAGDDTLIGKAGDDRLWPGTQSTLHSGHDTMTGGAGNDIFFFEDTPAALGADAQEVTDFTHGVDTLDPGPICHAHSVTCTFIGAAPFSGTAGEIRYIVAGAGTYGIMSIDLDGDATSDFDAKLDGAPTVDSGDISYAIPPARKHNKTNAQ